MKGRKDRVGPYRYEKEFTYFIKRRKAPQNSKWKKGDMGQVSYWGPTIIRGRNTKFRWPEGLEPGTCASLAGCNNHCTVITFMTWLSQPENWWFHFSSILICQLESYVMPITQNHKPVVFSSGTHFFTFQFPVGNLFCTPHFEPFVCSKHHV
jgi:hypothetical protein